MPQVADAAGTPEFFQPLNVLVGALSRRPHDLLGLTHARSVPACGDTDLTKGPTTPPSAWLCRRLQVAEEVLQGYADEGRSVGRGIAGDERVDHLKVLVVNR